MLDLDLRRLRREKQFKLRSLKFLAKMKQVEISGNTFSADALRCSFNVRPMVDRSDRFTPLKVMDTFY